MNLGDFNLNPLTLALIILGLVEFVKKFKVSGNKLIIFSMVIGIVLAMVYKLSQMYLPVQPYVELVFFGLAAGLCASGIYNFVNLRFPVQTKASLKVTKIVRTEPPVKESIFQ
jgi:xanthosine utilization system XapX-like protein